MTDEERKANNRNRTAKYRAIHAEELKVKRHATNEENSRKQKERYNSDEEFRKKCNEANKKSKKKHSEKIKKQNKEYAEKNKESTKEKSKKHYEDNKEKTLKRMKDRHEEKNEEINTKRRERSKKFPEIYKAKSAKRRSIQRNAEGHHSRGDIRNLFILQFNSCVYCKKDLSESYALDHIIPLARGGSNWPSNLQLLCIKCNLQKSDKDPKEYEKSIGFIR